MSDEPHTTPQQSYISRVRLKGYKSIIDTEVELKPGLNIIIGPNGSGKTNFVEFFISMLKFSETYECEIEGRDSGENFFYKRSLSNIIVNSSHNEPYRTLREKYGGEEAVNNISVDEKFDFSAFNIPFSKWTFKLIEFGIPRTVRFLDQEGDITFYQDKNQFSYHFPEVGLKLESNIIHNLLSPVIIYYLRKEDTELFDLDQRLQNSLLNKYLASFTPIKAIKISDSYKVEKSDDFINSTNIIRYRVNFIRLQFLVDGRWSYWHELSDGTKRLFYIITEITFANNVVLLEEPELGIHPHQLARLMDFIKEQSETKQIILTTHSPEVLNTLGMDELDRIIVARYDKEKGTQLRHLSKEDQEFARNYMKDELFLSDYWVMSGFETEEEGA